MSKGTNTSTQFRIRQTPLKIGKVSSTISYSSKQTNNKALQKKLEIINRDQNSLIEHVSQFIETLRQSSLQNDQNLLVKVRQGLENILKNFQIEKGTINYIKLKNHIKSKVLLNIKLSDVQKTKIENEIDQFFDRNVDIKKEINEIQDKIDDIDRTISNYKIEKDKTIDFYTSILGNTIFWNKITEVIKRKSIINNLTSDKREFQRMISKFKSDHNQIFGNPTSGVIERTSFAKMIVKGGMTNLFLIKYNNALFKRFKELAVDLDVDSMDTVRRRCLPGLLKDKLLREMKVWTLTKRKLLLQCTPRYWKKKFNRFLKRFKYKGILSLIGGGIGVISSLIYKFGMLSIKGFFVIGRLGLQVGKGILTVIGKGVTFASRLGLKILKGVFSIFSGLANLAFNIVGGVVTILKNILGLTFKISKAVFGKAHQILKNLKIFLLTPMGAYMVGFILGFLKEKIVQLIVSGKEKLSKETKEKKDKFLENLNKLKKLTELNRDILLKNIENANKKFDIWISEKHKNVHRKPIIIKKDKNGIPKITKFFESNIIKKILERHIVDILNTANEYKKIFLDDDPDNNEQFKHRLNYDTEYISKTLDLELKMSDFLKTIEEMNIDKIWYNVNLKILQLQNNPLWMSLEGFSHMTGTGVPTQKIASGITSNVVKQAFIIGGTVIGSFFGPLGAIIGGALAGGIGSILSYGLSKQFVVKASTKEKIETMNVLYNMNKRWSQGVLDIKTKKDTYDSQINKLTERLKNTTDEIEKNKIRDDIKKLEIKKRISESVGSINNDQLREKIYRRIDGLNNNEIIDTTFDNLIRYALDKRVERKYLYNYDLLNLDEIEDKRRRRLFEDKADAIRFIIKQHGYYYTQGGYGKIGSKEAISIYNENVKNSIEKINAYELPDSKGITLGMLTDPTQYLGNNHYSFKIGEDENGKKIERKFKKEWFDHIMNNYERIIDKNEKYVGNKHWTNIYENVKNESLESQIDSIDIISYYRDNPYEWTKNVSQKRKEFIIDKYFDFFVTKTIWCKKNNKNYKIELTNLFDSLCELQDIEDKQVKNKELKVHENISLIFANLMGVGREFILPRNLSKNDQEKLKNMIQLKDGEEISDEMKEKYEKSKHNFKQASTTAYRLRNLYDEILKSKPVGVGGSPSNNKKSSATNTSSKPASGHQIEKDGK